MPCSISFSMTLQSEILSAATSDFLILMIILNSFNFMFIEHCISHDSPEFISTVELQWLEHLWDMKISSRQG